MSEKRKKYDWEFCEGAVRIVEVIHPGVSGEFFRWEGWGRWDQSHRGGIRRS